MKLLRNHECLIECVALIMWVLYWTLFLWPKITSQSQTPAIWMAATYRISPAFLLFPFAEVVTFNRAKQVKSLDLRVFQLWYIYTSQEYETVVMGKVNKYISPSFRKPWGMVNVWKPVCHFWFSNWLPVFGNFQAFTAIKGYTRLLVLNFLKAKLTV